MDSLPSSALFSFVIPAACKSITRYTAISTTVIHVSTFPTHLSEAHDFLGIHPGYQLQLLLFIEERRARWCWWFGRRHLPWSRGLRLSLSLAVHGLLEHAC